MAKTPKLTKQQAIPLIIIATWIVIMDGIALGINLNIKWPIFMSSAFYFAMGGTYKQIPQVLLGGLFGIGCSCLLIFCAVTFTPMLGNWLAVMIPLAIMLYVMIVLGPVVPVMFNRASFGFLTICCINSSTVLSNAVTYIVTLLVGGSIMMLGCWGSLALYKRHKMKLAAKNAVPANAADN